MSLKTNCHSLVTVEKMSSSARGCESKEAGDFGGYIGSESSSARGCESKVGQHIALGFLEGSSSARGCESKVSLYVASFQYSCHPL